MLHTILLLLQQHPMLLQLLLLLPLVWLPMLAVQLHRRGQGCSLLPLVQLLCCRHQVWA